MLDTVETGQLFLRGDPQAVGGMQHPEHDRRRDERPHHDGQNADHLVAELGEAATGEQTDVCAE